MAKDLTKRRKRILTVKQEAFAKHYAETRKPAESYRVAGYAPSSNPHEDPRAAQNILRIPHVKERIDEFIARKDRQYDIRDGALLGEIATVAFSSAAHLVDAETGEPIPPNRLPPAVAAAIQEASFDGERWRYRFYDKLKALNLAAQIKGLVKDKQGGVTVTLNWDKEPKAIDITPGKDEG